MNPDQAYDYLLETGIATEAELALVSTMNGHNMETYYQVLFIRTGEREFDNLTMEY